MALDQQEVNSSNYTNDPYTKDADGFRHCILNFAVDYSGNIHRFDAEILLTDQEAYAAYRLLANKMQELLKTGGPVTLSMKIRTVDKKIICRCFSGIVFIEHDIPELNEVAEDEQ